jgi:uncharacterized protein (TIGR02246 family)
MMKTLLKALSALVILSACNNANEDHESDRAAIQEKIVTYAEAYRQRDANALAKFWSEDGFYKSPETGTLIVGREAIARQFEKMFAQAEDDFDLKLNVLEIDFPEENKAVERGTAIVTIGGEPPTASDYTATHVKEGDRWLLESVSEIDHQEKTAPPEQLNELSWMIGRWVDTKDHITIETDCDWTLDNHFIKSFFTIYSHDQRRLCGVHYIGMDPKTNQLLSWVFDSDGGYGTGIWSRSGNQWSLELTSTLADGRQASSVYLYKLIDSNTYKLSSTSRAIDGLILPNLKGMVVKRKQESDK